MSDIIEMAKEAFKDHALKEVSPNIFSCRKPNSSIYSFGIMLQPGVIAVWGDLGEWILRHSDTDSMGWLRGSVNSPQYVLGKVRAGSTYEFSSEKAINILRDEYGEDPERVQPIVDALDIDLEHNQEFSEYEWLQAWHDAGSDETPSAKVMTSSAEWLLEALKLFVRLHDELLP